MGLVIKEASSTREKSKKLRLMCVHEYFHPGPIRADFARFVTGQ